MSARLAHARSSIHEILPAGVGRSTLALLDDLHARGLAAPDALELLSDLRDAGEIAFEAGVWRRCAPAAQRRSRESDRSAES